MYRAGAVRVLRHPVAFPWVLLSPSCLSLALYVTQPLPLESITAPASPPVF